ncbi:hypothetical protein OCGS_1387 [Oceaniovalibus guishaninsula JLT2003]|uniref:Probable membrane transporter protein n=1 Tax=Oceaniovalibus guishaninsula JLT2003 TaxID=1231392 RepID=K2HNW1_9RHOB|nr:sulfite exporter TauE/SafE family protein [Oceaniovalibus guishaninsula]EKE44549.1 hypothetical protein OCGS_1387 [Oceaniovalibus guishaninsula JLT2003]
MIDALILLAAGFLAGIVNAIAGGGTFLTFPALVAVGVPPILANATSAVAVLPGYVASVVGFGPALRMLPRRGVARIVAASAAGGIAGGALLLVSSEDVFAVVVPFLLLAATAVFAFGNGLRDRLAASRFALAPFGIASSLVVAIYGGYFNGGLGIVLLSLYALWGMTDLNAMNGLKVLVSVIVSVVSVATFALGGLVLWPQALLMAAAAVAGGYAGARLARILPDRIVRAFVVVTGLAVGIVFLLRL